MGTQKRSFENYPHFGHVLSKKVHQLCPRLKMFKEYHFEGAQNF
jgi:hypothetical protein